MNLVVLDGFVMEGTSGKSKDDFWKPWKNYCTSFTVYDRTPPELILQRAANADCIFSNKTVITREIIQKLPNLKYIGVFATGYNVIDTAAAKEQGIIVTNIPAYSTDSVAQTVFALILEYCQKTGAHNQAVHNGAWSQCKDFMFTLGNLTELAGKTMGIFGYGRIGRKIAEIARAFSMNVQITSRSVPENMPEWLSLVSRETLFSTSDFISINCPLTEQTRNIINRTALASMKPNCFLVNTSRGGVIDEEALAEALNRKIIAGAGLDVLTQEPPVNGSPLIGEPSCIITPHIAWATVEAKERLFNIALNNFLAFKNGKPVNVVS